MGYTHYFPQTRAFTDAEWKQIQDFCKKLFEHEKGILANAYGEVDTKPLVNRERVSFNGIEDESHETCYITKSHNREYNFCKTAGKQYDTAVVALLSFINVIAPFALNIDSDGSEGDWQDGIELAQKLTLRVFPYPCVKSH